MGLLVHPGGVDRGSRGQPTAAARSPVRTGRSDSRSMQEGKMVFPSNSSVCSSREPSPQISRASGNAVGTRLEREAGPSGGRVRGARAPYAHTHHAPHLEQAGADRVDLGPGQARSLEFQTDPPCPRPAPAAHYRAAGRGRSDPRSPTLVRTRAAPTAAPPCARCAPGDGGRGSTTRSAGSVPRDRPPREAVGGPRPNFVRYAD